MYHDCRPGATTLLLLVVWSDKNCDHMDPKLSRYACTLWTAIKKQMHTLAYQFYFVFICKHS